MGNVIYCDFGERRRSTLVPFPQGQEQTPSLSVRQLLDLARTDPGQFLSEARPNPFMSPKLFQEAVFRANVSDSPPPRDLEPA